MTLTVVRGFEGVEKSGTTAKEGGQISYIKGSIGDRPVLGEALLSASTIVQGDVLGLGEVMLLCLPKCFGDNLASLETNMITNS